MISELIFRLILMIAGLGILSILVVCVRKKVLRKENSAFFSPSELQETTEYLNNPGQGWYKIFTYDAGNFFIPQNEKQLLQDEKIALIRISIEKYRSRGLTDDSLANIRRIFQFFDSNGVDMILRITYDLEGKGLTKEPDLFSQVKEHMIQISEIVREFEDRILVFQGLLVGSWGEMHHSKFLSEKRLQDLERAFRSQKNDNVWLALRRPMFLRILMGTEDVSVGKRTLFDDAIGSSETDMGTFGAKSRSEVSWKDAWGRRDEIAFMNQICETAPFGGEALLPEEQYRISAWEIIETMRKIHLSYLNSQHDKRVLELWKKECIKSKDIWNGITIYNYMGCHMGYRFCVRKVSITSSKNSTDWLLSVEIENTGFGNLIQESLAELIWINQTGEWNYQHLDWDARKWNCGCRIVCTAQVYPQEGKLYLELKRKWDGSRILFSNPMEQNMLYLGTILFRGGGKKRG